MFSRYSCRYRLKKAEVWLIRFGNWLRKGKHRLDKWLTVGELQHAEKGIVRYVQRRCYSIEFSDLASGKAISHISNIFKLEPFKDDGVILRVQGQLQEAPLTYLQYTL
ncbi:hypothetical protein HOLleu_27944 [Holothuria leucospilota]|uniref:Uncharacterized protein n=1 Tax=Holothuria leucospilota TaxID=206669 RepID=A0A9Q1BR34_HOLLE|nr:hypothetical protein HOLleu_27944 [Holothuria leucospilota]